MNSTFFSFTIFAMIFMQKPTNDLLGRWQLIKVEVNNQSLTPSMDFFLTVSESGFGFNRDANSCSVKPRITFSTIEFDSELCTRVCCDGKADPIGGMDLYKGNYKVIDGYLTIWNSNRKTYMKRVEKER